MHLGEDNESTLSTMRWLALYLRDDGQFEESEALTLELNDHTLRVFGATHLNTILTRQFAVELYEMWGKPDEADTWRD